MVTLPTILLRCINLGDYSRLFFACLAYNFLNVTTSVGHLRYASLKLIAKLDTKLSNPASIITTNSTERLVSKPTRPPPLKNGMRYSEDSQKHV